MVDVLIESYLPTMPYLVRLKSIRSNKDSKGLISFSDVELFQFFSSVEFVIYCYFSWHGTLGSQMSSHPGRPILKIYDIQMFYLVFWIIWFILVLFPNINGLLHANI